MIQPWTWIAMFQWCPGVHLYSQTCVLVLEYFRSAHGDTSELHPIQTTVMHLMWVAFGRWSETSVGPKRPIPLNSGLLKSRQLERLDLSPPPHPNEISSRGICLGLAALKGTFGEETREGLFRSRSQVVKSPWEGHGTCYEDGTWRRSFARSELPLPCSPHLSSTFYNTNTFVEA